jgi:hypothetical protein
VQHPNADKKFNAEDVVSTRSVQSVYANEAGIAYPNELMPKDIYQVAIGGGELPRLVQRVFNLDNASDRQAFYKDYSTTLQIQGTDKRVSYDPLPRLASVSVIMKHTRGKFNILEFCIGV